MILLVISKQVILLTKTLNEDKFLVYLLILKNLQYKFWKFLNEKLFWDMGNWHVKIVKSTKLTYCYLE